MQSEEWAETFTVQVGRGIDAARGKRSDQWISDRTKQVGHPISRTAISEYRRGIRKTITVTDWLVIAAALGVPPVTLLFPGLPNGPVHLLPHTADPAAMDAVQWVCGERQTIPEGLDVSFDLATGEIAGIMRKLEYKTGVSDFAGSISDLHLEHEASNELQLLRLSRKLASTYGTLQSELSEWFSEIGQGGTTGEARQKLVDALKDQVELLRNQIDELGGDIEEPQFISEEGESDGEG